MPENRSNTDDISRSRSHSGNNQLLNRITGNALNRKAVERP